MAEEWLAELRERYARSLPEKLAQIEALLSALERELDSPERRKELANAFHRIHGSAGSMGFEVLGDIAGECERALDRGEKLHPGAPLLARIHDRVNEMSRLAVEIDSDVSGTRSR